MKEICKIENCTGCAACYGSCPKHAIEMRMDKDGFYHPYIDEGLCVNCLKCERICPCNKQPSSKKETRVYLYQNQNKNVRFNSTSGGFFYTVADFILQSDGVVCGAAYDNKMVLKHTFVDSIQDINPLLKSKYVQSDNCNVYAKIDECLKQGKKVLYVGLPCQVAGVYNYFEGRSENLYLIDLVCYGVPSTGLFLDWVSDIQKQRHKSVTNVIFRDKSYGYATPNVKVEFSDSSFIESCWDSNMYSNLFFRHLSIRPSCYHCQYKQVDRVSDITLGDLWLLDKYSPSSDDNKGATAVFSHTEKGLELCKKLCDKELNLDEVVANDARKMVETVIPAKGVEAFWQCYESEGFEGVIKKYDPKTWKKILKYWIKKISNKTGFSKAYYRRSKQKKLGV